VMSTPPSIELLKTKGIKLLVCDMAGTTVDEQGLVYITLRECMNSAGLNVSKDEMHAWHGAQKTEVVRHFLEDRRGATASTGDLDAAAAAIDADFEKRIEHKYFAADSPVKHVSPKLVELFGACRAAGVKVALNTGYPTKIKNGLVEKLGFGGIVDDTICAGDVGIGRPAPYMVHALMKRNGITDARTVAKAGDTARDIEEGLHAGCGLNIGVLSGADSEATLRTAGADIVLPDITALLGPA